MLQIVQFSSDKHAFCQMISHANRRYTETHRTKHFTTFQTTASFVNKIKRNIPFSVMQNREIVLSTTS